MSVLSLSYVFFCNYWSYFVCIFCTASFLCFLFLYCSGVVDSTCPSDWSARNGSLVRLSPQGPRWGACCDVCITISYLPCHWTTSLTYHVCPVFIISVFFCNYWSYFVCFFFYWYRHNLPCHWTTSLTYHVMIYSLVLEVLTPINQCQPFQYCNIRSRELHRNGDDVIPRPWESRRYENRCCGITAGCERNAEKRRILLLCCCCRVVPPVVEKNVSNFCRIPFTR